MALAKEEGYMELDIKLAARWWLAPGGRNFGLSLEVEDTDGQRKPATHFFRPRNCSSDGMFASQLYCYFYIYQKSHDVCFFSSFGLLTILGFINKYM